MTRPRIVALDDYFPSLDTGFRVAEFNWLLQHDVLSTVHSTIEPWGHLVGRYAESFPLLADRLKPFGDHALDGADGAYVTFLNNAALFLPNLKAADVPFVLQLYPGGGLHLDDSETTGKLRAVEDSGLLRSVIVTNRRVERWLHEHHPGLAPTVLIPGVVVDPAFLGPGPGTRRDYYPSGSETLRLAFVAHKYSPDGRDKGFPDFVETVGILLDQGLPVEAHVVGNFSSDDVGNHRGGRVMRFHGTQTPPGLKRILSSVDVVVSLNRPGVLHAGQFDGFPTGSVVTASLCGAAIVATDHWGENCDYIEGRDIVIVPDEADAAASAITRLLEQRRLASLARFGLAASRRVYGIKNQLLPRKDVLLDAFCSS